MGLMGQQRLLDVLDKGHILHYAPFDLDIVWEVMGQMKDKPRKRASQSQRGNSPQRQWQAEVRELGQGRSDKK